MATSTRLFQGRVVEDTAEKKRRIFIIIYSSCSLSTILGRTPSIEEYKKGRINLTKFAHLINY